MKSPTKDNSLCLIWVRLIDIDLTQLHGKMFAIFQHVIEHKTIRYIGFNISSPLTNVCPKTLYVHSVLTSQKA